MNLRVLKLRSGEEIACEVLQETSENIVISKPMIFKTESMPDMLGRIVTVTSLQDWLGNTTNKTINLPLNHVVFTSEPNESTTKMYTLEIEKEKVQEEVKSKLQEKMNDADLFGMFLEQLMDRSEEIETTPTKRSRRKAKKAPKKEYLPPDMVDENELDRHMIMMQLYIPAEAIMNLITSGILKPETLLEMIKEVKKRNRFTGDEKNRKDFGTKLSDWNPDPNSDDYK